MAYVSRYSTYQEKINSMTRDYMSPSFILDCIRSGKVAFQELNVPKLLEETLYALERERADNNNIKLELKSFYDKYCYNVNTNYRGERISHGSSRQDNRQDIRTDRQDIRTDRQDISRTGTRGDSR